MPVNRSFYSSTSWRTLRRQCLERDDWECTICGSDDHLMAHLINQDGPQELTNLRTLCRSCHGRVNGKTNKGKKTNRDRFPEDTLPRIVHEALDRRCACGRMFRCNDLVSDRLCNVCSSSNVIPLRIIAK